jgi:hypothetical protein
MYRFSHRLKEDTYGQRLCFELLTLGVVRHGAVFENMMQREPNSVFMRNPAELEEIKQRRSLSSARKGSLATLRARAAFPMDGKGA